MGIDGAQFTREVLSLKNAGVTEAEVWINSKGGVWADGVSIVTSMLNSGIKFTTVNMGFADSTAGHIYQAGTVRKWMPYSVGLIHEIQGGGSDDVREALNMSVATMLQRNTNKTVADIRDMMAKNTMMTAQMAKDYGFATEVPTMTNIPEFTNSSDMVLAVTNYADNQIKQLLSKNKVMSEVNKVLALSNEASEAAQLEAINKLIEAKNAAAEQVTKLTGELATTKASLADATSKILAAENEAKAVKAATLVEKHKGLRIEDKPEAIAMWTNLATVNYEETEKLLNSIPLNASAPKNIVTTATNAAGGGASDSIAAFMAQKNLDNKTKRKA